MNLCLALCPVIDALFLKHFLHLERVPVVSWDTCGHLCGPALCLLRSSGAVSEFHTSLVCLLFVFLSCFALESGSFYTSLAVLDLTM